MENKKKIPSKREIFYIKKKYLISHNKFLKYIKKNKLNKSEVICIWIKNYMEEKEREK